MTKTQIILASVIFLLSTVGASAQYSRPERAVRSFYKYDSTHSQVFSKPTIDARKKWFTDVLYLYLTKELARQAEFVKRHPDEKPYFGDGLPFRPLDETCNLGRKLHHYETVVGKPSMRGNAATVMVSFMYPPDCKMPLTQYSVRLHKVKNAWYINDIEFEDGSTLLADLMRAEY